MNDDQFRILQGISGQLQEVVSTLADVKRVQDSQDRRLGRQGVRLWLVIVGFTLDVILTAVIGVILSNQVTQGNQLRDVQARIHANQVAACEQGNKFRMGQRQLWYTLFILSRQGPQQKLTPGQAKADQKLVSEFLTAVDKTYMQLNCVALYSLADGSAG